MSSVPIGVSSTREDDAHGRTDGHDEQPGLVLLYAPEFEQLSPAYVFTSREVTIGRDASNAICVPEQAVSRQHARIDARGARWVLQDLGSRNGTMVDGAYVSEVELEPGHEVRVGDAIFKFVASGAERYVGYRIDGRVEAERKAKRLTELVGGAVLDDLAARIERIAPDEEPVMVVGEVGTGKDLVAQGLHRLSGRSGPLVTLDCAAVTPDRADRELFGDPRGGDVDARGLVARAGGGTLLLDGVDALPLDAQAKLVRFLESREIVTAGGTERIDLRIVASTDGDLASRSLRADLLAHFGARVVRLPPIRERKEDVLLLARTFGARCGRPDLTFTFSFIVALLHYDWPLNVRELEAAIRRAVDLTDAGQLDTVHLPDVVSEHMRGYGERPRGASPPPPSQAPDVSSNPAGTSPSSRGPRTQRGSAPTEEALRALLARHRGNVAAVGRELGKERMQVHRWLKRYNIDLGDYR